MSNPMMFVSLSEQKLRAKPGDGFNWKAFNESFEPQLVSATELLGAVGEGRAFACCHNGTRSAANFYMGQHIGVDIDNPPGLPLVTLDHLLRMPFVQGYCTIIYPTLSHTEERPRYRLVFVLDEPIRSREGYMAAAGAVTSRFPTADKACVDSSRLFFGNHRIGDGEEKALYFGNVLPLEQLRVIYTQMVKANLVERMRVPQRSVEQTGDHDLDTIMHRLHRLDPYTLDYVEWVKVGGALGREFGDRAFPHFKAWSDRPGKPELTDRKWQSMVHSPHPQPAGMGSVIEILVKYGA